jgi:hypothetical protein
MSYLFDQNIDPKNPTDPNDLPPKGWEDNIDTQDYRKALFGFPDDLFIRCTKWEQREKKRIKEKLCK